MSIFVSVAAFRDTQLLPTLRDLIDKSDNPDDIHVGVLSQDEDDLHPDLSFITNLRYDKIHWTKAQGAGWARWKVMGMYGGQDYYFQIDSHMRFAQGWDTELISQHKAAQEIAENDKIIISAYPGWFEPSDDGDIYLERIETERHGKRIIDGQAPYNTTAYCNISGVWAGRRAINISDSKYPVKSWTVLAGYIFANGSIVADVPYEPKIAFMGEELCFAVRAYTRGYDIYSPNKMIVWHYYGRGGHHKPWDEDSTVVLKWAQKQAQSISRQKRVLEAHKQGIDYPINNDRYLDLQEAIGYNFREFYANEFDDFVKGNILSREITFTGDKKVTFFCTGSQHEKCDNNSCECYCHD